MAGTWLLVGLGNPGRKYAQTRHNFGYRVLSAFAAQRNSGHRRNQFAARIEQAVLVENNLVLMWPETYMNLSGQAVRAAAESMHIEPERMVVIHDDVDLPLGRLKIKKGGGDGGHRGIASIIEHLDDPGFVRIRGGVGRPPGDGDDDTDITDFVLSPFEPEEAEAVDEMIHRACQAVETVVKAGPVAAMNLFNRPPPDPEAPQPKNTEEPGSDTD